MNNGPIRIAEDQLRRGLPPVALLTGLIAAAGASGQFLLGDEGVFRWWALAGHAALTAVGAFWLWSPPQRAHLAATAVSLYLAFSVGTFVVSSGQVNSLIHLAVIGVGCFYFLVDRRFLFVAQLSAVGWFAAGVAASTHEPRLLSLALLCGIAWLGGLALHVGRVRVLTEIDRLSADLESRSRELDEARRALEIETEERRRAQEQALAARKLESLGVMAGGVAHDFNNLLVGIIGGTDLAFAARHDPKELDFALGTIRDASHSARDLCRKLLDFAGGRRITMVPLDLNQVAGDGIRLAATSLKPGMHIEEEFAPGLPAVEGDSTQIQQMIVNLVSNAAEAMGEKGGAVTVATLADPDDGQVVLRVDDEGPGVPEEIRDRIFDPFFTTKFTGRGLGLAAVAGAVRSHGGQIALRPSACGARIEIRLPPATAEVDPPGDELPGPGEWRGAGTVLLVDDEPVVLETGTRLLHALGFEVRQARSGIEAVAAVRREPHGYRAALVDATMPGMDGQATMRALREINPSLPMLLSSGFSEDASHESAAGVPFLAKPYGGAELVASLRALLGE